MHKAMSPEVPTDFAEKFTWIIKRTDCYQTFMINGESLIWITYCIVLLIDLYL